MPFCSAIARYETAFAFLFAINHLVEPSIAAIFGMLNSCQRKTIGTNLAQKPNFLEEKAERVGFEPTKTTQVEETQHLSSRRHFCISLYDVVFACSIYQIFAANRWHKFGTNELWVINIETTEKRLYPRHTDKLFQAKQNY
jgi:hypothetical protein